MEQIKMHIQPREIYVPEADPFKYDLLDRKASVEILTHLISSLEGPCVLAVDSAWGTGKTTFLRIWAQYLRNKEFPVVQFNAWEIDFSGNPLIALSSELTDGLEEYVDKRLAKKVAHTKRVAKELARLVVPSTITLGIASIPNVGPFLAGAVGPALAFLAQSKPDSYRKAQESVKKFRRALQDMAEELSERKNGSLKGGTPAAVSGSLQRGQTTTEALVDLNFKVPAEFRQRFKQLALDAQLKNVQLLNRAVEAYEREQGRERSRPWNGGANDPLAHPTE